MFYEVLNRKQHIEFLQALTTQDYPNMSKEDRRKLHRNVYKIAYPEQMKAKTVTADDLLRHGFGSMAKR